ncbi:MAG: response regulator, partial [Thermoproteota archaeon]|nr:response regulator [Thermoproteota archaeon]
MVNREKDNDNNSDRKRIMIINDRVDTNFSVKTVLEEPELTEAEAEGTYHTYRLRVYPFTDPSLALKNFKAGLYDLILIDIVMPKINGFEIYYKIREIDDRVKICFLTASDLPEETKQEMFPNEFDKICFMRMPIANED